MTLRVTRPRTILAVSDLAACARVYQRAFGWLPSVETPVYVELSLPDGRRLGLYQRKGFQRNTEQPRCCRARERPRPPSSTSLPPT